jgi:hypothetical protein
MKPPSCEACGREPSCSFSWFADRARWYAPRSGTWKFAGLCTADTESYYVLVPTFVAASERWQVHLEEKRWFDAADFAAMLERFKAAGGTLTPQRVTFPKGRQHSRMRANTKASPKERGLPRLETRG